MNRLRRAGLSFVSAITAELLVAAVLAARAAPGQRANELSLAFWFLLLVIPGWLLALPILLSFPRTDGWRLWLLALLGISIGPAFLVVLGLTFNVHYSLHPTSFWPPLRYDIMGMALAISSLSTVFYIGALKWFERPAATSMTEDNG